MVAQGTTTDDVVLSRVCLPPTKIADSVSAKPGIFGG